MADTDTPETSYGQQQDAGLGKDLTTATGDIRDLYAYYRLSDHELTNVTMRGKVHKKEPVWFEGHMNWTFKACSFKEKFYFGVEGDRLEEDTRETDLNSEPFPPYGSNGLHFTQCSFKESFEIRDNCNVVFHQCTFKSPDAPLTYNEWMFGQGCRVEFIECTFEGNLSFDEYCDVKFRTCEFEDAGEFFVKATNSCKLKVDRCDLDGVGSDKTQSIFTLSGGSSMTLHNCGSFNALQQATAISAVDHCHVRIYQMTCLTAEQGDVLFADQTSKIETTIVEDNIGADGGRCVVATDGSEVYVKDVNVIGCQGGQAVYLEDAIFRSLNVETIKSLDSPAIESYRSKAAIQNTELIFSRAAEAIFGEACSFECTNIEKIESVASDAVSFSGVGEDRFKDVRLINSIGAVAIRLSDNHVTRCEDVEDIVSVPDVAVLLDNSKFESLRGKTIDGMLGGIKGTNSHVRTSTADLIRTGGTGYGVELSDSVYDIRMTDTITGFDGGALLTESKGLMLLVSTITSELGIGAQILGCSGPTEWDGIDTISSGQDKAFVVTGDLKQLRVINVDSITAEKETALTWTQDSGTTELKNIQTISSEEGTAFGLTLTAGSLDTKEVQSVESQQGDALVGQVQGHFKAVDWNSVTSQQGKALSLDVSGTGEAFVATVSEITSQQDDAVNVTAADAAKVRFKEFGTVESQEGRGLSVTASGDADVAIWDVSSPITAQEGEACYAALSGKSVMTMRAIQGLDSPNGGPLSVQASDNSRFYAVDFLSECTSDQAVAWDLTASGDSVIDIRKAEGVSSTDGDAIKVTASGTSTAKFAHLGTVKSTSGKAADVSTSDKAGVAMRHLDSVESSEGDALSLNIGEGTEFFAQYVTTMKSEQGNAVSGTSSGRTIVHNVDTIETSEGQAIALSGGGTTGSFVEFQDIGAVTGTTPSDDLLEVTTVGHIRLVNIPSVDAGTSSRYVLYLTSNGAELGKIEVIDVVEITATEARGVVYISNCGDLQMYCTSQKGNITCPTGSVGVVLLVRTNGYLSDYASISNDDGSMRGVYLYVSRHVRLSGIDTIKGKNAIHSYACQDLEIIDCPSLTAPDSGEVAVDISVPVKATIWGREDTVIEAKDKDTVALNIEGLGEISAIKLHRVTVSADKGKADLLRADLDLYTCKFNGSTTVNTCFGKALKSEFTCGLDMTDSDIDFSGTKIQLGTNDGPSKDLNVTNCVFSLVQGEITGNENVSFTDSIFDAVDIDSPLVGADSWNVSNCVMRSASADWGADMFASEDSVLQFVKTDFGAKEVSLSGGANQVITGHLFSGRAVTTSTDSAVVLVHGTLSEKLTAGANNGVIGAYTDINELSLGDNSGSLFNYLVSGSTGLFGTGSATMINKGTIDGAITLNHNMAFMANNLTAGNHITTGNDLGILANRTSVAGNLSISSRCGSVLSKLDVTGSMTVNTDGGLTVTKGQVTGPLTIQQNCGSLLSAIAASSSVAVGASGSTFVNKGSFVGPVTFGTDCAVALSTLSISGTTTFDSGSGILGLRLDASGGAEIGDASGVIGARSSGDLTGADDSGVVLARYGSAITLDTATVGVIGARMPSAITLGDDGAMVVASGSEVADAGASIVADCTTATGKDMVIVRGATTTLVSASNAFTVGGSSVTGTGANVLSLGTTSPSAGGSEGGVAIGGTGAVGGVKGALSVGMDGSGTINQSVVSSGGGALSVGGGGSGQVYGSKGSALIGTDLKSGYGTQLHVGGSKNVSGGSVLTCGIIGGARGTHSVTVGTFGVDTISGESVSVGATSVAPSGSGISCVVLGNQWLAHDPEFGGSTDGAGLVLDGGATGSPMLNMNSGFFATSNCARAHNELGDDDVGCGTSWGATGDLGSSTWASTSDMYMQVYRGGDILIRTEANIDIQAGYGYQDSGDLSLYAGVGSGSTGNILSKAQGSHSSLGYTSPTHGTF